MTHVLRVPDKELVATAGIDALAFIRVSQFGIQLFFPIMFVVLIVFIPVHVSGNDLERQKSAYVSAGLDVANLRSGLNSKIMTTTAANLEDGAHVMWLHVLTFWGIVLYATWLLRRHTRTFALLRQLYLTTAGDTNLWRAVHMPTSILQQMLVQGRELEAEMDVGKMREQVAAEQQSAPEEEENAADDDEVVVVLKEGEAKEDPSEGAKRAPSANESSPAEKKRAEKADPRAVALVVEAEARERDPERAARPSGATPNAANGGGANPNRTSSLDTPRSGSAKGTKRQRRFSGAFLDDGGVSVSEQRPPAQRGGSAHGANAFGGGSQALTMSVEAMAFLATPALVPASEDPLHPRIVRASAGGSGEKTAQGSAGGGSSLSKRIARRLAGGSGRTSLSLSKPASHAAHLPPSWATHAAPLGLGRSGGLPERDRDRAGEREGQHARASALAEAMGGAAVKDPGEPETHAERPRYRRGGLKALKNDIKGLRKQQAAKLAAGIEGTFAGNPASRARDEVEGVSGRESTVSARVSLDEGVEGIVEGVVEDVEGSIARSRVTFTSDAVPTSAGALVPPPPAAASPRKVKKFKVPEGLKGGLRAAKDKVARAREVEARSREVEARSTSSSSPSGSAPGPVTESYEGDGSDSRGGGDRSRRPISRALDLDSIATSGRPPPEVYRGRDGTPTVYFGADADESESAVSAASARAAAAAARARESSRQSANFLERIRRGNAGSASAAAAPEGAFVPSSGSSSWTPGGPDVPRDGALGGGRSVSVSASASVAVSGVGPSASSDASSETEKEKERHPAPRSGRHRRGESIPAYLPAFELDLSRHTIGAMGAGTAASSAKTPRRPGDAPRAIPIPAAEREKPPEKAAHPSAESSAHPSGRGHKPGHRRNRSLPTTEYLATLGFGGVSLDEAFDLGGTRVGGGSRGGRAGVVASGASAGGPSGVPPKTPGRGTLGDRHSGVASGPLASIDLAADRGPGAGSIMIGSKTPGRPAPLLAGVNLPSMRRLGSHGSNLDLHARGGGGGGGGGGGDLGAASLGSSRSNLTRGSSAAHSRSHSHASDTHSGVETKDGGGDWAAGNTGSGNSSSAEHLAGLPASVAASVAASAAAQAALERGGGELNPRGGGGGGAGPAGDPSNSNPTSFGGGGGAHHHRSGLNPTRLVAGKGFLPADNIGAGASSPLFTPHVKRVLEGIAEVHRARHRRTVSGASAGSSGSEDHKSRDVFFANVAGGPGFQRGVVPGGAAGHDVIPGGGSGTVPGGPGTDGGSSLHARHPSHGGSSTRDDFFDGWVEEDADDAPDEAIAHEWWAGLNIDDDSDDDDYGDAERAARRRERSAADRFDAYYVNPDDEDYVEGSQHGGTQGGQHHTRSATKPVDEKNGHARGGGARLRPGPGVSPRGVRRGGGAFDAGNQDPYASPDPAEAMERGEAAYSPGVGPGTGHSGQTPDTKSKGAAKAQRLVELPVPDVNAKRTVNTYDPEARRLVSVWAANYTVLMTDLVPIVDPEDGTERYPTDAVEAMFEQLFPDEFRGIIPVFDHRPVDKLLDRRDELLNQLNKEIAKSRRSYQQRFAKRDWRVLTLVDAARLDLQRCERAIVNARREALASDPGPSCFVVFATQRAAAEAAQCLLHSGSRRNFRVRPAPGPDNVNWQTLLYRETQSRYRIFIITPIIALVVLFPSGIFTVGIASACVVEPPDGLEKFLSWYCDPDRAFFNTLISGLLPPILLTLWEVFVVSFFIMYLVQAQNVHASLSSTDRRFLRYYHVWSFANVLIGGITGGAITGFFEDAFRNSTTYSLQQHLGRVLPISSNFFLVFVFFRAVYLPVQRLIMPHPGIICWAVRKYLCVFGCAVTPRDRTVKYSPRGVRMGREVGVFLMVVMLGLTFSLTAPVMAPACVLFFVGNFVVWRYHVLYVYERGYESNGSMWYTAAELVVWSLLVAQSFTSCVLFSKAAWLQGIALYVTVPYYLYRYMVSIKAEFGGGNSWSVPLGLAEKAPPADFSAEIYTHPSLRPSAMGWHPDVGKVWRGYPGVAVKHTL